MELIQAYKKDEQLLEEMEQALTDVANLYIWWLGQSGFLIQCQGKRILLDPYLSDSLTKKYAHTSNPHIRMSEQVIEPSLLPKMDILTSSHNHTDHLDAETTIPILSNNNNISYIVPRANIPFVANRMHINDERITGINDGESIDINGCIVHGIAAAHNELERDINGQCLYMGYVIEIGSFTIYHSGDTLLYNGLVEQLKPFNIDVALLPINGNLPQRGVAGNLDCREAAELAHTIGAALVIPCHYNMFSFNTANVKEFEIACNELSQPYHILKGGEKVTVKK